MTEAAFGKSMEERVDWMIRHLEEQLNKGDFDVDVFGFSRGAASATLFLNKIQEKINEGKDERYKKINFRFIVLFDQVPSVGVARIGGRFLDTIAYFLTFTFWSPNTHDRHAEDKGFTLTKDMKFQFQPLHLIAIDEQRKEFAVSDVNKDLPEDAKNRALQVGFMGVHSDIGGGYGGSLFEFITRQFVYEKSKEYGLSIWDEEKFAELQSKYRDLYNKYKKGFRDSSGRRQLPWLTVWPHDSDSWKFNGHEPRHFPEDMLIHESVDWFLKMPSNSIKGHRKLNP